MTNIPTFSATLQDLVRTVIQSTADCVGDSMSDDPTMADAIKVHANMTTIVTDLLRKDRDAIARHFKNGATLMMLPDYVANVLAAKYTDKSNVFSNVFFLEVVIPGNPTPMLFHSTELDW